MTRRLRVLVPLFLLVLSQGCGPTRYPVHGRVTYEDGAPVAGGTVIGEATVGETAVGVQGSIDKEGAFAWGGERAGNGALPGNYRVLVMPRALADSERAEGKLPAVASKFGKYETSGLTFEVKAGKNEFPITVTRPTPKKEGQ